jgi:RecJ-like exonuclease
MPADRFLSGNGQACPSCDGLGRNRSVVQYRRCILCNGTGRAPLPDAEIVRRTVEEARRCYWPAVERAWAGRA